MSGKRNTAKQNGQITTSDGMVPMMGHPDEALDRLVREMLSSLGVERVAVWRVLPKMGEMRLVQAVGTAEETPPSGDLFREEEAPAFFKAIR